MQHQQGTVCDVLEAPGQVAEGLEDLLSAAFALADPLAVRRGQGHTWTDGEDKKMPCEVKTFAREVKVVIVTVPRGVSWVIFPWTLCNTLIISVKSKLYWTLPDTYADYKKKRQQPWRTVSGSQRQTSVSFRVFWLLLALSLSSLVLRQQERVSALW